MSDRNTEKTAQARRPTIDEKDGAWLATLIAAIEAGQPLKKITRLASSKNVNPDIKAIADRMVLDYTTGGRTSRRSSN